LRTLIKGDVWWEKEGVTDMTFPPDFEVPLDQGGPPFQSVAIGGFGGDPQKTQDEHRAVIRSAGKAPVILIHGNLAAADRTKWNMLTMQDFLIEAGYPEEAIWAPSYLGSGIPDVMFSHTNNVNEVRDFIENVCEYLDVEVVDFIAHSLGCTLVYAILRGLKKQNNPVEFDQPQNWHRVGTVVALAGAFHGFGETGSYAVGEWKTSSEFMRELLTEMGGGGGETPYGRNKPQTPAPAHNITYYCGIAQNDFVDHSNPGTGELVGAINSYKDLGAGDVGHLKIKESRVVFNEFLPLLNSVPPVERVAIVTDKGDGGYGVPLTITVHIEPSDKPVHYVATKVTKAVQAGILVVSEAHEDSDKLEGTVQNGQTLTISEVGMWEVVFSIEGTADVQRTYWVGVEPIAVTITPTDNSIPFENSLDVTATATRGTLYYSLIGDMWSEGPVVAITSDAAPRFIAIDSEGIASQITSKAYKKISHPPTITATPVEHYVANRIALSEYLAYGQQFGFTTPLALCLVNTRWVPCPEG
jgi:pimeloyl-ACP methyl ester carboxylesterase